VKKCKVWPGAAATVVYTKTGVVRECQDFGSAIRLAHLEMWARGLGRVFNLFEALVFDSVMPSRKGSGELMCRVLHRVAERQ